MREPLRQLGFGRAALLAVLAVMLVIGGAIFLPPAVDWHHVLRPGALALIAGQSPYIAVDYFSAPPWVPVAMIPLALLPEAVGRSVLFVMSVLALGWTAHQLGAKPVTLVFFLLSPTVLHGLLNGNPDGLAMLGFALPPAMGLFLVLIKPQIGIGIALFWLVEAWRTGGLREIVRVFWPITVTYLISFAVFGFWPLNYTRVAAYSNTWNASLWPASIPVGLALLMASLRTRNSKFALGAGPCLSPYVLFHSWSAALMGLAAAPAEMLAAVVGLWTLVALRAFSIF